MAENPKKVPHILAQKSTTSPQIFIVPSTKKKWVDDLDSIESKLSQLSFSY
jgi:glutaredoxin